jgi:hypothetical protein
MEITFHGDKKEVDSKKPEPPSLKLNFMYMEKEKGKYDN